MSDVVAPQQYGIENLKNVINFAATGVQVGFDVMADKKVDLADLAHVYRLVPMIGPFADSVKQLPAEAKDLDAAELQELLVYVAGKFVVNDEKAMIIINHSLKIAGRAFDIYLEARAMKQELDALKAAAPQA